MSEREADESPSGRARSSADGASRTGRCDAVRPASSLSCSTTPPRRPTTSRACSRTTSPSSAASRPSATSTSTRSGACRRTSRTTASACCASRPALVERATETLVEQLLPVLDSFELALESLEGSDEKVRKGVELVRAELRDVLEKAGLREIDALGTPFDPTVHEAVAQEDGDGEPVVSDVFRTGYRLKDRVLRPAMVKVTHGSPGVGRGTAARVVRQGLLRRARCPVGRDRQGDPARLPQAREAVPPGREPGGRGRGGAVQGDLGRERRARRRRQAQGVRRGPRDGRERRRPGQLRRRCRRVPRRVPGPDDQLRGRRRPRRPARRPLRRWWAAAGGAVGAAAARRARSAARTSRPSSTSTSSTRCTASTTSVSLTAEAPCSVCGGSGAEPGTFPETCATCGGTGAVAVDQGPFSFSKVCPTCGGRGAIVEDKCKHCKGSGIEVRPREVKVRVPAGVRDGQRIRVQGRGARRRERRSARRPLRGGARRGAPDLRALGDQAPHGDRPDHVRGGRARRRR